MMDFRKQLRIWWFALLIVLIGAVLQYFALDALRFDRQAIEAGQWWRVVTGNWVHLSWGHWWLNIASWLIVWLLFYDLASVRSWALSLFISSAFIGLGLWLFNPELNRYVGLSGVIYGLLVLGGLRLWLLQKWLAVIMLSWFVLKTIWEQTVGPMPYSAGIAGGPVVVDAHLYGMLSGLLLYALTRWLDGAVPQSPRPTAAR